MCLMMVTTLDVMVVLMMTGAQVWLLVLITFIAGFGLAKLVAVLAQIRHKSISKNMPSDNLLRDKTVLVSGGILSVLSVFQTIQLPASKVLLRSLYKHDKNVDKCRGD